MGYHYRARYELILFFEKGKRKLNDFGVSDVIEAKRVRDRYPTEKPVKVSEVLVTQSSQEGELVIDPFMGSGSVGVAALRNSREFLGCDIKEEAVELANSTLCNYASWSERLYRERLKQSQLLLTLRSAELEDEQDIEEQLRFERGLGKYSRA
jgi:site-specific DNA-methyltransferase (adenine-specific)